MSRLPRRPTSGKDRAEELFKTATSKPKIIVEKPMIPVGQETITISIDRDVLAHFYGEGTGWRGRINAALRKAANLG